VRSKGCKDKEYIYASVAPSAPSEALEKDERWPRG
jgi:hypothetical protein